MKKVILSIFSLFLTVGLMAQCSDLFISEYVEGSANNKALEIYNPTSNPINLSGYAIGRYSNGSFDQFETGGPVVLPNVILQPYDAYVIVLDRRQEDGTAPFDLPVWNGYNIVDIVTDEITNDTIIDSCRNTPLLTAQYVDDNDTNPYEYGTTYKPSYDLQGKADTFACEDYNANSGMSFNGNDAVYLISGSTVDASGSNVIDVIGVIGEDPEETIMQDAWVDANGKWITKNITIVRRAGIGQGTGAVVAVYGDTLAYSEWDYYCNNDFTNLGSHGCDCDPNFVGINEVLNEIPVNVQPNPAADWLLVNAPQAIQQIEVYDLTGKLVFQQNYNDFNTEIRLNVNTYQSGMYVVNVIFDDNQRTVKKFVVK